MDEKYIISCENKKPYDDPVYHPNHYRSSSGLEVIQVIRDFTEDLIGFEAVCTANVIKYICRWSKKNGLQDLEKARRYLDWLITVVSEREKTEKENKDE